MLGIHVCTDVTVMHTSIMPRSCTGLHHVVQSHFLSVQSAIVQCIQIPGGRYNFHTASSLLQYK